MRKPALLLVAILILAAGCITISAPPSSTTPAAAPSHPAPSITTFEAVPSSVAPGDSTTLQWQVANASTVSIDQDIGTVAPAGNRFITPASTTIYKLSATNQYGSSTATAQVLVTTPAPTGGPVFNLPYVAVFTVKPENTISDSSVLLTWDVQNAFDVVIEPGFMVIPVKGSSQVTPHFTTTYKLTATNDQGSIVATTTVTISGRMPSTETPVINYFKANPYVIHLGDNATLSWQTVGGSAVNIDNGLGTVAGEGSAQVSPTQTTTYMMILANPSGAQYQTVTVNVN